jgi:hypothetical protein
MAPEEDKRYEKNIKSSVGAESEFLGSQLSRETSGWRYDIE